MYSKNFTLKLIFILSFFLGNVSLIGAQSDEDNSLDDLQTTYCSNKAHIMYGNGTIIMKGKKEQNYIFKIQNENRQTIFECEQDCGNMQKLTDLPNGEYRVVIRDNKYKIVCSKWIRLKKICNAKHGQLKAIKSQVELNNETVVLQATIKKEAIVPSVFSNMYLLVSRKKVIQIDTKLDFLVDEAGKYYIHNLIIEESSTNVGDMIEQGKTIAEINKLLKKGEEEFCSSLDLKGVAFKVKRGNNQVETGSGSGVGTSKWMCNNVEILKEKNMLTISSDMEETFFLKINDKENHMSKVFSCKEDCEDEDIALELPNSTYLVTVYNKRGKKVCQEIVEINELNNEKERSAEGRNVAHFSLEAFRDKRAVDLQWLTNAGYKVAHFELEHSLDGIAFSKIQDLNNEDWTNNIAYHTTTDVAPELGINYYRIKQVYEDDSYEYSPIQQINFSVNLEKTKIFPNPAQEELFVNLKQYIGAKGQLTLFNQFGHKMKQLDLESIDQDIITINTSDVRNGIYYLNINVDGYRILNQKVLIQRFY